MTNRSFGRITIALVSSIMLNGILIAIPFFTDRQRFPSSEIGKIVAVLGRPGGVFTSGYYQDTTCHKLFV